MGADREIPRQLATHDWLDYTAVESLPQIKFPSLSSPPPSPFSSAVGAGIVFFCANLKECGGWEVERGEGKNAGISGSSV